MIWFIYILMIEIVAGVSGYLYAKDARATENWPKGNGKILECIIQDKSTSEGPCYVVNTIYEYIAEGAV